MKRFITVALIALIATPLAAQQPARSTPAAAPAATLTLDTPIEALVVNPRAKAVIDQVLQSDITQNPFYPQIKAMSFNEIQPLSNGQLDDATMKKLCQGLAAIN